VLTLGSLFGTAFFLYVMNGIGNFHIALPFVSVGASHPTESLSNFALLFLALGLWQRRRAWRDLLGGVRWHTRSHGVSRLEAFLPIRTDWVQRYADPCAAFLVGMCLNKAGFSGLGVWIMFSAVCLRWVEEYSRDRQLEADLDSIDALLESEVAGETAAHFEGENKPARSVSETGGIPTGADAGLEAVIARRKKAAGVAHETR
jgi:hypothetical protein